jgi:hypothetical protein
MSNQIAMAEFEALKLLAYLTASADISLFEPDLYGPFRLIDAASQLAECVLANDPGERRDFWQAIKAEIDQKKIWLMHDRPGFREFLAAMPGTVAKELAKEYLNERMEGWRVGQNPISPTFHPSSLPRFK